MPRLARDAEALQGIPIEDNPVRAQHRAHPQAVGPPVFLAAEAARNHVIVEPLRMRPHHAGIDEPARRRLPVEVIGAAAEKHINAAADLRRQKRRAGRADHGRRRLRQAPILKPGLDLRAPLFAEPRPVQFEGRRVFALEEARDVARAADHPPIDPDRPARLRPIPRGETARVLVADRLVVRRDDHHGVVGPRRRTALGPQRKRHRHDRQQRPDDQPAFHRRGA